MEYRVVILGSGGVGKSALVIRHIQKRFVEAYDPTIEDSYRRHEVVDGESALVDVLDTAGQEEYTSICDNHMRSGDGFLIVYSVTSRESFSRVSDYRMQVTRVKDDDFVPVVVCGNKCDLESNREVQKSEGEAYAKSVNAGFLETSAKDGINTDEVFYELIRAIRKDRIRRKEEERMRKEEEKEKEKEKNADKDDDKKKKKCIIL